MSTVSTAPKPLSRMRRAVAKTVTLSASIPQFSVQVDVPFARVRESLTDARVHVPGASISDVINAAVIDSLREHPLVNSSFTEEGIVAHDQVALSFMVESGDGLLTPVIHNADARTLAELSDERVRLTHLATAGGLTAVDLLGGTFTVSNLGPLGVHRFNALVIPGQSAILAVGAPTAEGVLTLTLSVDHRVVDGAPAARFLSAVGERLTARGSGATETGL